MDTRKQANRFPTSGNPNGWNNNNFGRSNVPSNIPFEQSSSGNPFGNFNPMTSANPRRGFSNFEEAYTERSPMIERRLTSHNGMILHNNIADKILDEHVVEYRIGIDSIDRDIKAYPNPFDFIVKFAANSSITTIKTEVIKNGKLEIINETAQGTPMPHINRDFRNVKYVKIENVVLPRLGNIVFDDDSGEWVYDGESDLSSDRFTVLSIDELECCRIYSTGDDNIRTDPKTGDRISPPKPFAIVIRDRFLGINHFVGIPYYGIKVFNSSTLGNINSLSLKFSDSCGVQHKYNNLFTYDELKKAEMCGDPVSLDDIRHPLNKNNQVYVSLVIGVVESQINTETKFER